MPDRLCWWCKYFYYIQADGDWSDITPGQDFSISCGKGHRAFDAYESSREDFSKCITAARTCNDFVPVENLT
jgi:hypothetical protein